MNVAVVVAAASILSSLTPVSLPPAPRCGEDASSPTAPIDVPRVKAALNDLLAAEGLGAASSAFVVVRHVDLDGDPSTEEALVDVVSVEHCVGACETLVVRAASNGALFTSGHGKALGVLASRSAGWMDLSVNALPGLTVGALKFSAGRYR